MSQVQTTISPIDGSAVQRRNLPSDGEITQVVEDASKAFKSWKTVPLDKKIGIVEKFLEAFATEKDEISKELTLEMGRPIRYGPGEVNGFIDRGKYLVSVAKKCLADLSLLDSDQPGFKRYIRREPLGVILIISAWNYPYLIQVNSIIPALLSGNTILLKPSPQTPSAAERIVKLLIQSGLPPHVASVLHLLPAQLDSLVASPLISHVVFTGSVANGEKVSLAASKPGTGFKGVGLELGGKDAAYVRADVDAKFVATEIADGGYFNSGQSCCGVERVYVHEKVYDTFVEELVKVVKEYKLGDPREADTTLGPLISTNAAKNVRTHIAEAVSKGAKALVDEKSFPMSKDGSTFIAPQVLVNVDHTMQVMTEETFGPVVGVMKVKSDEEALALINDSKYGLTASIWTNSDEDFLRLMGEIEAGTVFMNRCDYLDPALPWTGVKESGRGISLSTLGYDALTRAKSVHIKHV